MADESSAADARRQNGSWSDLWSPASWTLWTETWLLSLAAHLAAAIIAALLIRGVLPQARNDSSALSGGFLASLAEVPRTQYFTDEPSDNRLQLPTVSTATSEAPAGGTSGLPGATEAPPLAVGISLPQVDGPLAGGEGLIAAPVIGSGRGRPKLRPGLDEAAILAADAAIPREQHPTGPTAQLSLFGAVAEGRSFVFVIDRSASMGSDGLGVLQIAAKELAAHIHSLSPEQNFQVVAYNQSVAYLYGRDFLPASEENQRKLVRFVADLAAFGQTEHARGLLAALKLKPEVIYLLTDGGEPALDPGQLRIIREQAAGRSSIHCVQFGRGPVGEAARFLQRLAAENRGSYVYIDVNGR